MNPNKNPGISKAVCTTDYIVFILLDIDLTAHSYEMHYDSIYLLIILVQDTNNPIAFSRSETERNIAMCTWGSSDKETLSIDKSVQL